jgi:ABC-2 type transport system permease protein
MRKITHIYRLGLKELASLRYDYVLIILIVYCFTAQIIVPAKGTGFHLRNASIAVVNEDGSQLAGRIIDALQPPQFKTPQALGIHEVDLAMERGHYTFIVDIPPDFQKKVLAGRNPEIQINIDGTAVGQANTGATYLRKIIAREVGDFVSGQADAIPEPVTQIARIKFNPNLESQWFTGLMMLINMITTLAIILPAAALLREKEHGTVEHLLVMPLYPMEIMFSKIWANSLVVAVGSMLSLSLMVKGVLGAPMIGSFTLFLLGTLVYLFATTGIGILLATISQNSAQMGLLSLPVIVPIVMLSGGLTPREAMPEVLQYFMKLSPTGHYLEFAESVLFRGAGITAVWTSLAAVAAIGVVVFFSGILRFHATFR